MSRPSRNRLMPISTSKAPKAQVAQDFDALQRVDVGVHVAHAHALFVHVFGEVFGHTLRQCRDQNAIALQRHLLAFGDDIIDLGLHRADDDRRIDEARGADDLFGEDAAGLLQLP